MVQQIIIHKQFRSICKEKMKISIFVRFSNEHSIIRITVINVQRDSCCQLLQNQNKPNGKATAGIAKNWKIIV